MTNGWSTYVPGGDVLAIPCPTCRAEAGKKCRTLHSQRITDTHVKRIWKSPFIPAESESTP
jgi:hypothetical protein